MTVIRALFLLVVLGLAVTLSLANRAPVTLAVWPDAVTAIAGFGLAVTLPLFVVVGAAFGLGLFLGLIWEWLRERGVRVRAAKLQREVMALRAAEEQRAAAAPADGTPSDEILALVSGRKPAA